MSEKSNLMNNRIAYILLAIFFGALGIHNFYAGRFKQGIFQLILTALSVVSFGITGIIAWIWAIYDAITVKTNGQNQALQM